MTTILIALSIFLFAPLAAAQESPQALNDEQLQAISEAYQSAIERIPALAQLQERGARILPLGRAYGLDGWLAQDPQGGVEFYYSTPDGLGLIQGLLFAPDGTSETQRQLTALEEGELDLQALIRQPPQASERALSPGEAFLADVRNAAWFAFGEADAPPLYVFVDPRCPFCKRLFDNLARTGIPDGAVQLRLILVPALGPESLRQSALLLDSDNPSAAWIRLMAGDLSVVEGEPTEVAERIVRRNGDLTLRWKVDGVPFAVYRNTAGEVSIVSSEPSDIGALLSDLGPEWPQQPG